MLSLRMIIGVVIIAALVSIVLLSRRLAIAQNALHRLAAHDALTGLSNHSRLEQRFAESVPHVRRSSSLMALLLVDIDRFKNINDLAGHAAGDELLRAVAARLLALIHTGGLVSRVGGDEFAILLDNVSSQREVAQCAQNLRDAIKSPFRINDADLLTSASVGVAFYPDDGSTLHALIQSASAATTHAKEAGRDTVQFYTPRVHACALEEATVERDLRGAASRGEMCLNYQPIVALHPDGIWRFEALVRWNHPQRGLVRPDAFIPVAERSGLMPAIGDWILREALNQVRQWRKHGLHAQVSVNVSMREFQEPRFFERLFDAFEVTGTQPRDLTIEITESVAMSHPTQTETTLRRCKDAGVRFALDDFGTHYSFLSYLARLPIDSIKIDKSFVNEIPGQTPEGAIIHAVIALAHSLGLLVVAEGVENREQLEWLRAAGCDLVQGYLLSKPQAPEHIEGWVNAARLSGHRG